MPVWVFRVLLVGAGLFLWFWTQKLIGKRAAPEGRIGDALLDVTEPVNRYLHRNPGAANVLLIGTSALIDLLGLFLLGQAVFGPSARPFVGLLILFGLRQVCQGLCALPPPEGMIWRSPGVPSIFVTYGTSTDLFFSGHTALAIYGSLELAHWGGPIAAVAGALIVAIEIAAVIVLRAHYTMDVFAGIVAALWVWSIVFAAGNVIDPLLSRLAG